jgi:hypothetical protein
MKALLVGLRIVGIAGVALFAPQAGQAETPPCYLMQWGTQGAGAGEFESPQGMAIDGNGFVYVVDTGNHRIQKFTTSGAFVTQ